MRERLESLDPKNGEATNSVVWYGNTKASLMRDLELYFPLRTPEWHKGMAKELMDILKEEILIVHPHRKPADIVSYYTEVKLEIRTPIIYYALYRMLRATFYSSATKDINGVNLSKVDITPAKNVRLAPAETGDRDPRDEIFTYAFED